MVKETKQSKAVVRGAAFLGLLVLAVAGPGCASMQNEREDSTRETGKYIDQDRAAQSGGVSNYYDPETDRRDHGRARISSRDRLSSRSMDSHDMGKFVDQETAVRMGGVGGYVDPETDLDSDQRAGLAVDEDIDHDVDVEADVDEDRAGIAVDEDVDNDFSDEEAYDFSE
jgi:hypothetical protein